MIRRLFTPNVAFAAWLVATLAAYSFVAFHACASHGQCPGGSCSPYSQPSYSSPCQGGQCGQTQWMPVSRVQQPSYFPETPQRPMASVSGAASNGVPRCQYPSLVRVACKGNQSDTIGTGFVADAFDGKAVIVTCAHGYKALQDVEVHDQNGGRHSATVIGVDSVKDLLVCVIRDPGLKPMVIADKPPVIGDKVYMAGFPGGTTFLGSWGQVTGWVSPSQVFANTFVATSCTSKSGCSGGPIMNEKGEVIAIVTGTMQVNSSGGGSVGPCLQKTLPEMNVARIAYKTAEYQESMLPWRSAMEKSTQATNRELQQINGTLRSIQNSPPPAAPVQVVAPPLAPTGPDYGPAINQINGVLQEHNRQLADMPKVIDERVKPIADKVEQINANIAKHGTLLERIAAAKSEDPEKSTLAAVKEAIAARFKHDDGEGGKMEHKDTLMIVSGGLFILFVIAGLVHYHRTGHGLVAEAFAKMGRPGLAEKEEAIHDKIHGAVRSAVSAAIPAAALATGNPLPAAGLAVDKIHDVKSLLESLHAKMDSNTATSQQAAQAATAAAMANQTK